MRRILLLPLLLLAACSFAPLRFNIDLLERFPEQASGSFLVEVPGGVASGNVDLLPLLGSSVTGGFSQSSPVGGVTLPVSLLFPDAVGTTLDFRSETLPADLDAATLNYRIEFSSQNLSGTLQIQFYLAPVGTDNIENPEYALGPVQSLTLGGNSVLEASIPLSGAQLTAINDQQVRLALALSGDLTVVAPGEVSLEYTFRELSLDVSGITAALNERLPDPDGYLFDFSDEEIPGSIVDAELFYELTLSHDLTGTGTLTAQVYVAPPGGEELFAPAFAFGDPQEIDLSQQTITLSGQAELNSDQRPLLDAQSLRVGVRVTGTATAALQETIEVGYVFETLQLRVGYSVN